MLEFVNRIPIGQKLVGLIAGLLAIMLVIAAYSEYVTMKSGEEIEDLTQYLIPPQNALAKISTHLLQQQVHVERALRLVAEPKPNDVLIDAELDAFRGISTKVNKEIKTIEEALTETFKSVNKVEDAVALARLEAAMPQVDKEHKSYEAQVLKTIEQIRKKLPTQTISAIDEIAREQHNIEEIVDATQANFGEFIGKQALVIMEHERKRGLLGIENLLVAIAAFIVGLFMAIIITRRMLEPIRRLIVSTNAVAKGDLSVNVEPTTKDELGALTIAFRDMTQGLREKETIKQTFSQYVDPRIVRHLLAPGSADLEGDRRNMTVFFSDIVGFTSISERLTPQALVRLINAYLVEMSKPIAAGSGVIDKFIGDAIMAYWGAPFVGEEEHPRLAVHAGLEMFQFLDRFRLDIPEITGLRTGAPDIDIRIGIATGPVLIGNMGSTTMKNYTIMGDTVNLAARLEGACKEYGIRMLVSDSTCQSTKADFLMREIDLIAVKGKVEPTRIFEPMVAKSASSALLEQLVDRFAGALSAYREQRWDEAEAGFKGVLAARPSDGPSGIFLERVSLLRATPPGSDWDGVWRMKSK